MSEIRTIPETILASGIKDTSIDAVGKFDKKVIHHNAGPPTAADDTGLGYAVGSIWVDTSNGDMYTATDVTAEDATWMNMDGDNVNVIYHQGSNYGWTVSGNANSVQPDTWNETVYRHSFTSDENAADWGEFTSARMNFATNSPSFDYGYCAGGQSPPYSDVIERFPTTTSAGGADGADIGEITRNNSQFTFGSNGGSATAIIAGGTQGPSPSVTDQIETFPMAAPTTTSDTGSELSVGRNACSGGESDIVLFTMAGSTTPTSGLDDVEVINKTTYSSADTGSEMASAAFYDGGQSRTSSTVAAYKSGGQTPPGANLDTVQKVAFASPYPATDVGNLVVTGGKYLVTGSSSTTHGYATGGQNPGTPTDEVSGSIEKFAYASDGDATDVAEISPNRAFCGGTQS